MLPEPTPMEYTMEHFQEDLRSSAYVGGNLGTVAAITNTTSTATTTTITTTTPTTTKDDKAIENSGQLVETAAAVADDNQASADSQQMEDISNRNSTIGTVHSEENQSAGSAAEAATDAHADVVDDTAASAVAADHTGNVLASQSSMKMDVDANDIAAAAFAAAAAASTDENAFPVLSPALVTAFCGEESLPSPPSPSASVSSSTSQEAAAAVMVNPRESPHQHQESIYLPATAETRADQGGNEMTPEVQLGSATPEEKQLNSNGNLMESQQSAPVPAAHDYAEESAEAAEPNAANSTASSSSSSISSSSIINNPELQHSNQDHPTFGSNSEQKSEETPETTVQKTRSGRVVKKVSVLDPSPTSSSSLVPSSSVPSSSLVPSSSSVPSSSVPSSSVPSSSSSVPRRPTSAQFQAQSPKSEQFRCEPCMTNFSCRRSLQGHRHDLHQSTESLTSLASTDSRQLKCRYCPLLFTIHEDGGPEEMAMAEHQLTEHSHKHSNGPCEICLSDRVPQKAAAAEWWPCRCPVATCRKGFKNQSHLARHLKLLHGVDGAN